LYQSKEKEKYIEASNLIHQQCVNPQQILRVNDELRYQKSIIYIHEYIEAEVDGSVLTLLHA
jgi:uncharacterized protein YueI